MCSVSTLKALSRNTWGFPSSTRPLPKQIPGGSGFWQMGNGRYRTVKAQLSKLEEDRSVFSRKIRQADSFSQLIEEYSDITELTSELLHTLIDHVVVHEKEEIDGEVVMRFDIHYRFIGRVGDANGDDTVIKPTKNAVTMYKNRVLG